MPSDEPPSRRNAISKQLRLVYEAVADEPIPVAFQRLLRRLDGDGEDDDLDPGVPAEPPERPRGGLPTAVAQAPQRSE